MEVEYEVYVNGEYVDYLDYDMLAFPPRVGDCMRLEGGGGVYVEGTEISDKELVVVKVVHVPNNRKCEIYTKCRL